MHGVPYSVGGCLQVQGAIESLKIVTGHLAAWSLPKYVHVTVEPFLRPHADYFSGVAFQARPCLPGWLAEREREGQVDW